MYGKNICKIMQYYGRNCDSVTKLINLECTINTCNI